MTGLPSKYAKMGFKRGWAAFNKSKRKKRRVQPMARRRRKGGYFRKKYRSVRKAATFGNVTKILIGAGLAAIYEVFVSPIIPLDGMIKNVVEIMAGIFLASMSGMPSYVRAFGGALAIINAYSLIVPYVQGYSGGAGSGSTW